MSHSPMIRTPVVLLVVALTGCSSTGGSRFGGGAAPSRSIAVVGDRTLPAAVGDSGGQVAAGPVEPEPRRNPKARIAGRVIDDQGQPVPGATVRLADGGIRGGRDIRATTDDSGAFTLGGLRPGSTYSLIAEADGDNGVEIGRADARTSDVGVQISLGRADGTKENAPATKKFRPSRVRPISSREEAVGNEDSSDDRPRVNSEDLPLSADEIAYPDGRDANKARPARPQLAPPEPLSSWRKPDDAPRLSSAGPRDADTPAAPATDGGEDEGINPLPPAIDPGPPSADDPKPPTGPTSARPRTRVKVGGNRGGSPPAAGSGQLALAADSAPPVAESAAAGAGLPPMPAMGADSAPPTLAASESLPAMPDFDPSPTVVQHPVPATPPDPPGPEAPPGLPGGSPSNPVAAHPASEPVFASPPVASPPPDSNRDYNPFALVAANPTPEPNPPAPIPVPASEPVVAPPAIAAVPEPTDSAPAEPAPAIPRKKWGDLAAPEAPAPKPTAEPTARPASLLGRRSRAQAPAPAASLVTLCDFDPKAHRLKDFRLPDLEGKPVRFADLDADFVLIDFWGTWCQPCLESIPHLVDLQKQYGPSRLKVVGIACEKGPPDQRAAQVDAFARKVGINYTVLLSSMDGTCPVQKGLQVRYYPTMILLDRKGQVLWTAEGATPANLFRLDRALAAASPSDRVRR